MFWKFDLHTSSHLEALLDKEDVTLTELMDEEDVLQECKAQNRRLLQHDRPSGTNGVTSLAFPLSGLFVCANVKEWVFFCLNAR